jgi:hypothetical protein
MVNQNSSSTLATTSSMLNRYTLLALLSITMLFPVETMATSSGIIRRSTLTSAGCGAGSCHGASVSTRTVLSIVQAVDGEVKVAAGSTVDLTLRVRNEARSGVGCNISVKTTLNGNTDAGTLSPGEGLRSMFGELTQTFPVTLNNEVDLNFQWTAPATEGTYYLHAIANAVNRNGSNDPQDEWNWLEPVKLVVGPTASVREETILGNAMIAPLPAHDDVTISSSVTPGEDYDVTIVDGSGNAVRRQRVHANTGMVVYVWNGRTDSGAMAPSGTYHVSIVGRRDHRTASVVIIR